MACECGHPKRVHEYQRDGGAGVGSCNNKYKDKSYEEAKHGKACGCRSYRKKTKEIKND